MDHTTDKILGFVARLSSLPSDAEARAEQLAWLDESISFVEETYHFTYGGLGCRPTRRHMCIHRSTVPFRRTSPTLKFISDLLEEGKSLNREVVLVVSGWDGLTCYPLSFINLFDRCLSDSDIRCRIRIFAGDPRRFFDVNVQQAVNLLSYGHEEGVELEGSTEEFCLRLEQLFAAASILRLDGNPRMSLDVTWGPGGIVWEQPEGPASGNLG